MSNEVIQCWNLSCKKFDVRFANNCNDYFNHCTDNCNKFVPISKRIVIEKIGNEIIIRNK